ncbi:MAG: DUF58 domain-containing protein [Planctomycetia bacterium]|nr:DUF58 domain-containing protein [Planctomycetia bacterium]
MASPSSSGPAGSGVEGITDPQGLALVARMELVARTAVEGLLSGLHPSPSFGSSVEYADHRPYTTSDELRMLDWKLLAKTDKYYVRLYEEETNTRITVILDTSRSMAFGSAGGMTKLDYGRFLAAAVCHLALKQNDAAGLATFDRGVRSYLPPRSAGRHFRHILADLARVTPGADTAVNWPAGFPSGASSCSSATCSTIPPDSPAACRCSSTCGMTSSSSISSIPRSGRSRGRR